MSILTNRLIRFIMKEQSIDKLQAEWIVDFMETPEYNMMVRRMRKVLKGAGE